MHDTSKRLPDPRPARTRASIYTAVTALAASGIEPNVRAVVAEAGISRSAFYAQFDGLDELATAMLTDTFREIGVDAAAERASGNSGADVAAKRDAARLIYHLDTRRSFYKAMDGWKVGARSYDVLTTVFAEQIVQSMDVMGDVIPKNINRSDAALYIAGGVVSLAMAWIRDPAPCTPTEMTDRLLALMPLWLVGHEPSQQIAHSDRPGPARAPGGHPVS